MSTGAAVEHPRRLGILAVLVAAAAFTAWLPKEGALLAAATWGLLLIWLLPRHMRVALPVATLLMLPVDHIAGLNGPAHGFFVFGTTFILALAAVVRWGRGAMGFQDWDFHLLIIVLCGATLLNAAAGELRGVLFWIGAGLFLFWLRVEEEGGWGVDRQLAQAVLLSGAIGGMVAVLDYTGILDVTRVLPGYQPNELDFSYQLGTRASGLSGHPLRLGTLTMLASIFSIAWLLEGRLPRHRGVLYGSLLTLSLGGLVLSGARGSWLGFAIALVALVLSRVGPEARRSIFRMAGYAALAGFLIWVTGLWSLIHARLFGAAAHPGSLNQRMLVVEGIRFVWTQVPPLGVGFGGAAEMAMRMGLKMLNLENEYLRFFFTAGLAGPVALILFGYRRVSVASRRTSSPLRTAAICGMVGLLVNAGTYNVFSWSMGAPLLALMGFLALPLVGVARVPNPTVPESRRAEAL